MDSSSSDQSAKYCKPTPNPLKNRSRRAAIFGPDKFAAVVYSRFQGFKKNFGGKIDGGKMGEREDAASCAPPQPMRIFIGGVGPTVTAADVEKTFSSLGRVAGVDFVRTNGRNFAYMNFEPHSAKTLAKLFSIVSSFVVSSLLLDRYFYVLC